MRVLASPAFKNRHDNPYNAALSAALEAEGVEVRELSRRRVFLEKWDIVHIHWPEGALNTRGALKAIGRACYLLAKLLYAKLRGARLVWTVHNLRSHDQQFPGIERFFWKAYVPLVDAAIHLSQAGMAMALAKFSNLRAKGNFVVPLGHYRDFYINSCDQAAARAKLGLELHRPVLGFVGRIRPYKNCPTLVRAFLAGLQQEASLVLAGIPASPSVVSELIELARGHSEILHRLERIPDREIQFWINACDLAVRPYADILNSSSALFVLSFNRPLLVPELGAMAELRQIVGEDWVRTYTGDLTPAILRDALRWALETTRSATCDLGAFQWDSLGKQTIAAYQTTIRSRRRSSGETTLMSSPSTSSPGTL